jgi:NAD(P)-dependent dehydrogenase (short-subunit alcohol dehydrogenase family)
MYIVITGTSRGIGLELTRLALENGHHVLAVARHPFSDELLKLKNENKSLNLLDCDLTTKDAEDKILESVKAWPAVDLIINNAGIYLDEVSLESFEKTFLVNTIKPFLLTQKLFPKLKASLRPASLQVSSQMGSLADNLSGGAYSYRASKSALNMLFQSLSISEDWLISTLVHPGWVKTRMGGDAAPVLPHESAEGIWKLASSLTKNNSGKFYNYKGEELPW